MKKWVSSILVIVLCVEYSPVVFAQSNPQSEVNELQRCINDKFSNINIYLARNSSIPLSFNSQDRLHYSKLILLELLISFDRGLDLLKSGYQWMGLFGVGGSLATYFLISRSLKSSQASFTLEQYYKKIQYNGVLLAQEGGEEVILARLEYLKLVTKNASRLAWGSGILSLMAGFFGYLCIRDLLKNKNAFVRAEGDIQSLLNAKTEMEFNQHLLSTDPMIAQLRTYSLQACQTISNIEVIKLLKKAQTASPKELQDSTKKIQLMIDDASK